MTLVIGDIVKHITSNHIGIYEGQVGRYMVVRTASEYCHHLNRYSDEYAVEFFWVHV
jgi:type III secretory pathway component EscR